MIEWWMWALIVSWPLSGLGVWVLVVARKREVTVGDAFILPLMIAVGWVTVVLWVIANAGDSKVLWRW